MNLGLGVSADISWMLLAEGHADDVNRGYFTVGKKDIRWSLIVSQPGPRCEMSAALPGCLLIASPVRYQGRKACRRKLARGCAWPPAS